LADIQHQIARKLSAIPHPSVLCPEIIRGSAPNVFEGMAPTSSLPRVVRFGGGLISVPCNISENLSPPSLFPCRQFDVPLSLLFPQIGKFETDIQDPISVVSDNLFFALSLVRVLGMNYRDRNWHQLYDPQKELFPQKPSRLRPFQKSGQREQIRNRKPKTKPPSFWDLIYVMLQPPIVLEHLESLFFPHPLRPFQPAGIEFLMKNESALLADEMGTGKTVMTVVALRVLIQRNQAKCALVVCPLSIIRQWSQHLADWAPELLMNVVYGTRNIRNFNWQTQAHVYVTTYDALRSDIENGTLKPEQMDKFDIVVLDEAQNIKNRTSGRSKAVKKLQAHQRWILTGTPIENKIEDIAALFDFLRPNFLTSFDMYPERVKAKIQPYFLRRRKADVLPDLPPKQKQDFWLELSPEQHAAYTQVAEVVREELTALGEKVTRWHILNSIQRLKQICNFPPGQATSPKVELLKEQIEEVIENGQKVIVFSQYLGEGIDKLEKTLVPYGTAKIVGGQSENVRNAEVERFKHNPDVPILLASVRAGGVGLNLTEASYVVHFDHWWNPAVMWQAEDRVHRLGQTRGVNIYSYWISDTIEERIYRTLQEKGLLFQDVVDALSESDIDKLITTDDLLEMVGVKRREAQRPISQQSVQLLSLTEIRDKMYAMPPSEFERLARDLMHCLGYPQSRVTKQSRDGGVDVIASRNTERGVVRAVVQCKRYAGTVGVEVARELMGVMASDSSVEKGFILTTGEFSNDCVAFCERSGKIATISGLQAANYVKQFGLGV